MRAHPDPSSHTNCRTRPTLVDKARPVLTRRILLGWALSTICDAVSLSLCEPGITSGFLSKCAVFSGECGANSTKITQNASMSTDFSLKISLRPFGPLRIHVRSRWPMMPRAGLRGRTSRRPEMLCESVRHNEPHIGGPSIFIFRWRERWEGRNVQDVIAESLAGRPTSATENETPAHAS
jgi:hypothetical protein